MSNMVGEAFVRVRPDTKGFAGEAKRGVTSGLKGVLAVGGISIGLAEVIKQTKDAIAVERDRQIIFRQAQTALKAGGASWDEYGTHIDEVIQKQSKLSAFDDEDLLKSFTLLFRATKDVNSALDLNSIAANVARGRNMDLVRTAQLLVRVQAGQVGSLRRLGIQIDKNATGEQAIAAVRAQYNNAALTFANSQLGAQARLNKVWNDTQEIIGGAVAPALADAERRLGRYLDNANQTGETQRRVNEAMRVTGEVLKGVSDGVDLIRTVAGPAVEALGGIESTVKLVIAAFAISKVIKFGAAVRGVATSFGFIAASSRRTTAKVVADAAVAEEALDTAYRPRNVIVTTTTVGGGGPILGPDGKPLPSSGKNVPKSTSRGSRLGRFVRKIPVVGPAVASVLGSRAIGALAGLGLTAGTVAALEALAILSIPSGSEQGSGDINDYPFIANVLAKIQRGEAPTKREAAILRTLPSGAAVRNMKPKDLQALNNKLAAANAADRHVKPSKRPEEGAISRAERSANQPDTKPTTPKRTTPRRLTFKQVEARIAGFEEDRTDAQLKQSRSDELKALKREEDFLRAQLQDKKRSADQRRQIKDSLLSVTRDIDSINQDIASERGAAAEKAKTAATAAAKRASDKRDNAIKARVDAFERQARRARLANDSNAELKALDAEAAFLRKQISLTKAGSERRGNLQDELLKVQTASKKITDKTTSTSKKSIEADLRAAGISAAAHITARITGQDPSKLGVFASGGKASGTSTASGSAGVTGSVQTVSVDQLLRDLAVGQAQRDALALSEAKETNRLLRIIAPGPQTPTPRPRGRNIDGLSGIGQTRETATATGGLP